MKLVPLRSASVALPNLGLRGLVLLHKNEIVINCRKQSIKVGPGRDIGCQQP